MGAEAAGHPGGTGAPAALLRAGGASVEPGQLQTCEPPDPGQMGAWSRVERAWKHQVTHTETSQDPVPGVTPEPQPTAGPGAGPSKAVSGRCLVLNNDEDFRGTALIPPLLSTTP